MLIQSNDQNDPAQAAVIFSCAGLSGDSGLFGCSGLSGYSGLSGLTYENTIMPPTDASFDDQTISSMSLSAVAQVLDAEPDDPGQPDDLEWPNDPDNRITRSFDGVSTDSRSVVRGELFVALQGERFDGTAFVAQARARGAVAAVVNVPVVDPLPQIVVGDTRLALGRLAAHWRNTYKDPLIAVTGSNGKTTVKEIVAIILRQKGPLLATHGNLNNDIGLPLTLLKLRPQHRYAVVEMGANHPGEIAYLTRIARPDIAIITNAGSAHLEGFGSLQGVAQAKGEIFQGLGRQGTAVINADDAFCPLWRELVGSGKTISFGLNRGADVHGEWTSQGGDLNSIARSLITLHTPVGEVQVSFALPGRHNVVNALAACAVALAAGASLQEIKQGLEAVQAVPGRSQYRSGHGGSKIIDDTYNANPDSFEAALDMLRCVPDVPDHPVELDHPVAATGSGTRILVMGDMAELGDEAETLHRGVGSQAKAAGIDTLFAIGKFSRAAVQAFGEGACHYESQQAMIEDLRALQQPGVTILVKGSRAAHMEQVVAALTRVTRNNRMIRPNRVTRSNEGGQG